MAFPPLGNSDHVVVSVSIDFPSYSQWDPCFHCIAYGYSSADWGGLHDYLRDAPYDSSCADWDSFHDHLRDALWEDIFKLSASASASGFYDWIQVGMDVYIPH